MLLSASPLPVYDPTSSYDNLQLEGTALFKPKTQRVLVVVFC